jgi:peptidoglycan/xylan/chitin deacetylase (PgdA/CDA1 family)
MSERWFSFRWDVDHHACVTDGLPRILRVCREIGVPNTFFVNMGRSTDLSEWLRGFRKSKAKLTDMSSVSLVKKAGWPRFLKETMLARPVGLSFPREIEALQKAGHELGLHGGMNHVTWSRRFAEIPEIEIEADVQESHDHFRRLFGIPAGFTSPGFRSDDRMMRIVDRLGFAYDGDKIGGPPHRRMGDGESYPHWTIPVTICGPDTVPFLEFHGARRTDEDAVFQALDPLLAAGSPVVMYGHPCYEGVRDDLLRKVFKRVLSKGFRFVTHSEIAARLDAARAAARVSLPPSERLCA